MKEAEKLADELILVLSKIKATPHNSGLQSHICGESLMLALCNDIGECTPGELTRRLGVSSARVASTLKALESKGEVLRIQDSLDKRKTIIKVTDKGLNRLNTTHDCVITLIGKVFDKIGVDDSKELVRILGKVQKVSEEEINNA